MTTPTKEKEWTARVSRFLKVELKRADVTYDELAERLKAAGFEETGASIANKLSRGTFSAVFFFAVAAALEIETFEMKDLR